MHAGPNAKYGGISSEGDTSTFNGTNALAIDSYGTVA